MIYTVTFNPSLDYIVTVPHFTCGMVNRTSEEKIFPGGKGINVSMVQKRKIIPRYFCPVLFDSRDSLYITVHRVLIKNIVDRFL